MKQFLMILIITALLSSCNQKKSKQSKSLAKPQKELKVEKLSNAEQNKSTMVYWQTNFDTIRQIQNVTIDDNQHQLELKSFSLNDSSIVRTNEIYHDRASEIILTQNVDTLLYKKLTKDVFKDSLGVEFYNRGVLSSIEFENIDSDRLYFKGKLNVPDTGWLLSNEFSIYFRTEKRGLIDFENFQDIGN